MKTKIYLYIIYYISYKNKLIFIEKYYRQKINFIYKFNK